MKNIEEWFVSQLSKEKKRKEDEKKTQGYSFIRPANQLLDTCEFYHMETDMSKQLTADIGQDVCVIWQRSKKGKEAYFCIASLDDVYLEMQLLIDQQNEWYLRRFTLGEDRRPMMKLQKHDDLFLQIEHHFLPWLSQKNTYRLYAATGSLHIYNQLKEWK